jgi:hypothetical protein
MADGTDRTGGISSRPPAPRTGKRLARNAVTERSPVRIGY